MLSKKVLLLIMIMVFALTGCHEQTDTQNNKPSANTDDKTDNGNSDNNENEVVTYTDPSWARERVFYEIFVRSFCDSDGDGIGDFNGVTTKIPYLKDLGVDAIWLMPMMDASKYHGYDVTDYYGVEPDYGTMEDFKNLVKQCHDNDIKIIIDFVVNHTSIEHEWFQSAIYDEKSQFRDYYTIYGGIENMPEDTSGMRYHKESKQLFYGSYDYTMPDLNYHNPKVREEVKKIAAYWLELGVDGFRLDGAKEIDKDMNVTHEWWKEFSEYVLSINPTAFIVGENWLSNYNELAPFYEDMTSSFNFPLNYAIEGFLKGNETDLAQVQNVANGCFLDASKADGSVVDVIVDSTMIGNHDMTRIASRTQSLEKAKLAAALQFTLPGTPFIYYGDELGQTSGSGDFSKRESFDWYKSGLGEGMTDNKKACGADPSYTLPDDKISLEEQKDNIDSIYNYYKKLISIRKENPIMFYGTYETVGWNNGLYAYSVKGAKDGSTLLIIHNNKEKAIDYVVSEGGKELITDIDIKSGETVSVGAYKTLIIKY
ncbi:MAG: hypothetical protein IJD02_05580 [Lachnospiraceae bacterium]|nr:hypothetical protein [Lachnospiraceae bacterium]